MAESVEDAPAYQPKTYAEQFEELCPMYMSMGMSYAEFWDGDAELVKPYRRAHELRIRHTNWEAWLMGLYVYEGFSIAYSNAWSKERSDYPTKPHPLTEKEVREEREAEQRMRMEKLFGYVSRQVKASQGGKR